MDELKAHSKAIAAFVAGILINAILALVNGQAPWPQTAKEWVTYFSTALLAGVSVWVTGNKLTEKQIVKQAVNQGVTVVTDQAIGAAQTAVVTAVKELLPQEPANTVADLVSQRVSDVLKGVSSNFDVELKDVL